MVDKSSFLLVETVGIEPMTSCMSSMRSNQLSYASATDDIIPYAEGFVKGFLKSFLRFFCFRNPDGFGFSRTGQLCFQDRSESVRKSVPKFGAKRCCPIQAFSLRTKYCGAFEDRHRDSGKRKPLRRVWRLLPCRRETVHETIPYSYTTVEKATSSESM